MTRLGDHNRHVNEGTEEDIRTKRVIVHPHYNKIPTDSDIAIEVSQLHKPATLSTEVKTVCLPSQDEVVHKSSRCFITGLFSSTYHNRYISIEHNKLLPPRNSRV